MGDDRPRLGDDLRRLLREPRLDHFADVVRQRPRADAPSAVQMFAGFTLETFAHVVPGVLLLWSAVVMSIRASRRARRLALVALSSSLASLIGCTCSFTAIALCVWGWLVLTDGEVRRDFAT